VLLSAHAVVAITATTFTPWRASVSNSIPRSQTRVAHQQHHLTLRVRQLRRQRIARPRAQAAKRARVEPAARLVAVHHAPRIRNEVAAVADHDRVAVERRTQLRIQPHRVKRRAAVLQLRALGVPALRLSRRSCAIQLSLASAAAPAPLRRSNSVCAIDP